ncbi:NIL domain-containing protein [Flindersiella endophytica]
MRDGRFAESGKIGELLAKPGSELARELFPLGPPPPAEPNETIADVTFTGDQSWVAALARNHAADVRVLAGATEIVAGLPAGRLRIALPGRPEANAAALDYLRGLGLIVEVTR